MEKTTKWFCCRWMKSCRNRVSEKGDYCRNCRDAINYCRRKNDLKRRARYLKYGSTGDFEWNAQNGLCGICKSDLIKLTDQDQHFDHCHRTGTVRGWLCRRCNLGIEKFHDDPALLRAAADYMERTCARLSA